MAPYLLLILAVCAADQLTKLWAMNFIFDHATAASGIAGAALPLPGDSVPVIDGVLHFTLLRIPACPSGCSQITAGSS